MEKKASSEKATLPSLPPDFLRWMKEIFGEALKDVSDEMLQAFNGVGMIGGLLHDAKQAGGVVHLRISDDGGLTGHFDYGPDDPECPWRRGREKEVG